MSTSIHAITSATMRGVGDYADVTWRRYPGLPVPDDQGGDDAARVLVRLNVDEQVDHVLADLCEEADLHVLDRAIAALVRVRNGLAAAYGDEAGSGGCLQESETGRCRLEWDHTGGHRFPPVAVAS